MLMADSKDIHNYHVLVLNMSCGEPILTKETRRVLLSGQVHLQKVFWYKRNPACDRHCVEQVVSFGVKAVIPSMAYGPMELFLIQWMVMTLPLMDNIH